MNQYSRLGYVFNGWNTSQNGTGTSYTEGQIVNNLSSLDNDTINLYGQWTLLEDMIDSDEYVIMMAQTKNYFPRGVAQLY